ncbi:ATP-binding protein [Halomonas smyrnensis]|uniref:ATP-binding protein n=1 Tax=Halomonas smyrnensis TaxID=720605 RepID=UPI000310497A|nr:ATP-binding protein [Halomonas smyrnensis]
MELNTLQGGLFEDPEALAQSLEAAQFRMTRLAVFNWGTFDGLHELDLAREGFLITGRSGSGKSTLLDAISTLLTPPRWVDFNAAARDNARRGRDRNLVSYVRGAWADREDDATGEVATQYLRPGATWSALALTFATPQGQTVTLVHLYWVAGTATAAQSLRKHFMLAERAFSLRELEGFDLDLRRLKQRLTDVQHVEGNFAAYAERFRHLLGIESETALRLLHKTQSAKNLGDLNEFLRHFMLDRPETFTTAERLVEEFDELDAAHQAVVKARRQRDLLRPAREAHQRWLAARADALALEADREALEEYRLEREEALLEDRLKSLAQQQAADQALIEETEQRLAELDLRIEDLKDRRRAEGGDAIAGLERELKRLDNDLARALPRRAEFDRDLETLDLPPVRDAAGFGEHQARAEQWLDELAKAQAEDQQQRDDLITRRNALERRLASLTEEITALRRRPSNIPANLQVLRRELARSLNLGEDALPFAGELLQVDKAQHDWRGPIERVLRPLALTLLVEGRRADALQRHVQATDLGDRLNWQRVDTDTRPRHHGTAGPDQLPARLTIKPDHAWRDWLADRLQQDYDHHCVEKSHELARHVRAVTRAGLVREDDSRFEKADDIALDDPRAWVLGFDNREKLALFEEEAETLGAELTEIAETLDTLDQEQRRSGHRQQACHRLLGTRWEEVDVAGLRERQADVSEALRELREGNDALASIEQQLTEARHQRDQHHERLTDLRATLKTREQEQQQRERRLAECRERNLELDETRRERLSARFEAGELTLDNLEQQLRRVDNALQKEINRLALDAKEDESLITSAFEAFQREFHAEASDHGTDLADADGYFERLARIEQDNLPAFEARFFELLNRQSRQNLVALETELRNARKLIRSRLDDVNTSLAQASFNPGTHLKIRLIDRELPRVSDFRRQLTEILSHQSTDDTEHAEAQFAQLRELVAQLTGRSAEEQRWREQVLDVRFHVEFMAIELDAEDHQLEVFRSGAGKSGGQRQKLATTCLAAALSFQLGGDEGWPRYASVVLDEAFDKADHEFTATAMRIFQRFGFQMVVATPLKSISTLEPFIGGACLVEISERNRSALLPVAYNVEVGCLDLPGRGDHAAERDADAAD